MSRNVFGDIQVAKRYYWNKILHKFKGWNYKIICKKNQLRVTEQTSHIRFRNVPELKTAEKAQEVFMSNVLTSC